RRGPAGPAHRSPGLRAAAAWSRPAPIDMPARPIDRSTAKNRQDDKTARRDLRRAVQIFVFAEATGFEPAISGVTDRYVNLATPRLQTCKYECTNRPRRSQPRRRRPA